MTWLHWLNADTVLELLLAVSLSAAVGFRVFVPLLGLSLASVVGHIDLPSQFDWLESPQALTLFAIAAVLEIIGYSIPWADHLLDIIATPAAVIAGTLVTAAVAPEMDPVAKWALAAIAGGGTAGLTKSLLNLLRGASTATTGGLANPLVAALELVIAVALSVLAITVPLIAGVLVALLLGFASVQAVKLARKVWGKLKPTEPSGDLLP